MIRILMTKNIYLHVVFVKLHFEFGIWSGQETFTTSITSLCVRSLSNPVEIKMGGGDLNSKKSWHPNTIKNQEKVWKAEQAAAEEKKRILELQRERAEERDRAELNDLAKRTMGANNDNCLHWMYDKPDKKVNQEDYLLGKTIEKTFNDIDKSEQDNVIPAVARRVAGSSIVASAGSDTQVDLVRKLREDPLLLVKERERAARAALLNNPLQRKKLTELLRKEQDKKESQSKSKSKKKDKDLDNMLAAKLNALAGGKGMNLATLLATDDSSSDSSSEDNRKSKKEKKKKKSKKNSKKSKKRYSSPELSEDDKHGKRRQNDSNYTSSMKNKKESRKRKSDSDSSDDEPHDKKIRKEKKSEKRLQLHVETMKHRDGESSKHVYRQQERRSPQYSGRIRETDKSTKRGGLSEAERAAKLAEMAAAGVEREEQRGRRVAQQRAVDAADNKAGQSLRLGSGREARSLPDSLESRIHSTRHYIQRDKRHMDEHFARR